MCSNKRRITDILDISIRIKDNVQIRKNLYILHDEAHNPKEGIPPYREIIENILLLPNVISYTPVSASLGDIADETNPLWIKSNLEKTAINYLNFDKTKSTSPDYSSISDYKKINIEEYYENTNWINYDIKNISSENFMKVDDKYKNKIKSELKDNDEIDINRRRQLDYCQFMKNYKENEALNNGLNILKNLNTILSEKIFIKNKFNLHIISTPCRKIITQELCLEAIKQDYNPIVLGIYGNQGEKYHLYIDKKKKL